MLASRSVRETSIFPSGLEPDSINVLEGKTYLEKGANPGRAVLSQDDPGLSFT